MCGVSGAFGHFTDRDLLHSMLNAQHHRGPDARGEYSDPSGDAWLGHNRLAIIDTTDAGNQPMLSRDGRFCIVFNGEIYNYLELRSELTEYPFRSRTDTEVLLAAFERWGPACLDRLIGMFAFIVWDAVERRAFAARDRFGVKPLYRATRSDGTLVLASEIKALHDMGVGRESDGVTWATYLTHGVSDHNERTFWRGIQALPAGHALEWRGGRTQTQRWYDLAGRVGPEDDYRPQHVVEDEYLGLLEDSVRLRFRSDVPVGINLSGGLDSSTLLGLVQSVQGRDSDVSAYTFVTGDERYDELPWVQQMVAHTRHPSVVCPLRADEVPGLTADLHNQMREPFGGIPTIAYARLFEVARSNGTIVLLDGQGMDEQWAGYDYYRRATAAPTVQGSVDSPVRPECLAPDFRVLAEEPEWPTPFGDPVKDLQYRDICFTKIPRALRYNDRVSMRSSTELREPFLDHRLVELALRQPVERKLGSHTSKVMLRRIAGRLALDGVVEAPKRPLQTPQREWLRGPLSAWVMTKLPPMSQRERVFRSDQCLQEVRRFTAGETDNGHFIWQWLSAESMLLAENEVIL